MVRWVDGKREVGSSLRGYRSADAVTVFGPSHLARLETNAAWRLKFVESMVRPQHEMAGKPLSSSI